MRKHAGLAHVHLVGEQTNGQPFQPVTGGKVNCHIKNRSACEFAFTHKFGCRVSHVGSHGCALSENQKISTRGTEANARTIIYSSINVKCELRVAILFVLHSKDEAHCPRISLEYSSWRDMSSDSILVELPPVAFGRSPLDT